MAAPGIIPDKLQTEAPSVSSLDTMDTYESRSKAGLGPIHMAQTVKRVQLNHSTVKASEACMRGAEARGEGSEREHVSVHVTGPDSNA